MANELLRTFGILVALILGLVLLFAVNDVMKNR